MTFARSTLIILILVTIAACSLTLDGGSEDSLPPVEFDPGPGAYGEDIEVSLTCSVDGVTIYYTLDSRTPDTSDPIYTSPIAIHGNGTTIEIRAIAMKAGWSNSAVASASFGVGYPAYSEPTILPTGGSYSAGTEVTLTAETHGATIRFTTDGSDPTLASPEYDSPIVLGPPGETLVVRAIAIAAGFSASDVATATFHSKPIASPPENIGMGSTLYNGLVAATFATETPNAVIRYTLDGSEPSTASTAIEPGQTVSFSSPRILKARTFAEGYDPSRTATWVYLGSSAPQMVYTAQTSPGEWDYAPSPPVDPTSASVCYSDYMGSIAKYFLTVVGSTDAQYEIGDVGAHGTRLTAFGGEFYHYTSAFDLLSIDRYGNMTGTYASADWPNGISFDHRSVFLSNGAEVRSGSGSVSYSVGGEVLWSQGLPGGTIQAASSDDSGTIYAPAGERLYALDYAGNELWSVLSDGVIGTEAIILEDRRITFGTEAGTLFCITAEGAVSWALPVGSPVSGTPAQGSSGLLYFGTDDSSLHVATPDGSLLLSYDISNVGLWAANIDSNGLLWFYIGAHNRYVSIATAESGLSASPWPKYRQDAGNTGSFLH